MKLAKFCKERRNRKIGRSDADVKTLKSILNELVLIIFHTPLNLLGMTVPVIRL